MKSVLKLKTGSFLFAESISLTRNIELEVDSEKLSEKEIKTLNAAISSGAVESTEGLFSRAIETKTEITIEDESKTIVLEEKTEVEEKTQTEEKTETEVTLEKPKSKAKQKAK